MPWATNVEARREFVTLPGKNDSFSRWRRITTACGDIIRTRIRRMLVLLPAIHRGQKGSENLPHQITSQ
jgi:hypothetical protein